MIKLSIVDPEGGEPTQKSPSFKDPRLKHVSLQLKAKRTADGSGMDLIWSMHFSSKYKKSKNKHDYGITVETTIGHPTDSSKSLTKSNKQKNAAKTFLLTFFF